MNVSLISCLWLASQVVQIGVLLALFKRGWLARYPAFTAYIVVQIVSDPLLAITQARFPPAYYFGYWATVLATTALAIVILYEVLQHVLPTLVARRKLRTTLIWLSVAFVAIRSVTNLGHRSVLDCITSVLMSVDRDIQVVTCGVGLFLLVFHKRLGISWRDLAVGIVAGFVLFSAVHMVVTAFMTHPTALHRSTLVAINSAAYNLAALIWLAYAILSPNRRLGGSPGSAPPPGSGPGARSYAFQELR